jgi:hypothetical protein
MTRTSDIGSMKKSSATVAVILILTACSGAQASTEPDATGAPEASASSAPAESSAPDSAPMDFMQRGGETGSRQPGTYVLNYSDIAGAAAFPTLAFTFTLPAGWERVAIDGLAWGPNGTRIRFAVVDGLYVDPCDPTLGVQDPPVGTSVDDLALALGTLPHIEIGEGEFNDYFGGFSGLRIPLTTRADPSSCAAEELRLAHTYGFPGFIEAFGGGERHEMFIVAVEGTRVVVDAISDEDASDDVRAALMAVVDSILITP